MTEPAVLTVDLGNTSGSAALVTAGGTPVAVGAWRAGSEELEAVGRAVRAARERSPRLALAAISAVGSHDREDAVVAFLSGLEFDTAAHPDPGLEFRIDHPETCGSDRKYAARGALVLNADRRPPAEALLIVDAGTALTVDAVAPTPNGDMRGAFLGGAIALGPGSLSAALSSAGARLPAFDLDPAARALGRSTEGALQSGVVVGFRGSVLELCWAIAMEAHGSLDSTVAYLTGGARDFARTAVLDLFGDRTFEDPLLVHRGLAAAMRDAVR